jgi:hypothetical protein
MLTLLYISLAAKGQQDNDYVKTKKDITASDVSD